MDIERAYGEAGPKIVGYLVATGSDEATARDILHDAVARVMRRCAAMEAAGESPADLPALLFVTARNLRRNLVRDGRRMEVVESPEELDPRAHDGRHAMVGSDAGYIRRRISAALAALPEALREAYTLYQVGERSVREVAGLTGASENLVKVRIHRAKAALRISLADLRTHTL